MTVLRPSLPPFISTTTRTLSLPASAARAVLATNCGTTEPRARSDEPCSVWFRNWRRVNMGCLSVGGRVTHRGVRAGFKPAPTAPARRSGQLVFGQGEDGVDDFADTAVQGGPGRLALLQERRQLLLRARADAAR